jgi:four helix bundle protein
MKDEVGRMNQERGKVMTDPPVDLRTRTKQFALRVIRLFCALPDTKVAQVLGTQLLRAGTSVGAHYREGSRARSTAEFISKLEVGLQELDAAEYWMELLTEGGVVPASRLADLHDEVNQLIAIMVTCVKNAKDGG